MKLLLALLMLASATTVAQPTIDPKQVVRMLALGDSYTIGESVAETERWPMQLAEALRQKGYTVERPAIIATTGWRTDQLRDAIAASRLRDGYNLVSLLIGVNNYYQGKPQEVYAKEFEELLHTAIHLAGDRKDRVFVVSIPDYGYTPFGQPRQATISAGIDTFNAINKRITDSLGVPYFDITPISREGLKRPELVAGDQLHPSGKMYAAWVSLIAAAFPQVK
ncbi:MAG: SGNH/GDSL hydrolase family protein [Cyclobacteriaceae bacterium]